MTGSGIFIPAEETPPVFACSESIQILAYVSAEVVVCAEMGYNTVIIYAMEVTG